MCYMMVAGSVVPSTLHEFASPRWKAASISLYRVAMFEGAKHRGGVSSLHSNQNLLNHVGPGKWFPRHPDKPSAQLSHKFLGPWAKHA